MLMFPDGHINAAGALACGMGWISSYMNFTQIFIEKDMKIW